MRVNKFQGKLLLSLLLLAGSAQAAEISGRSSTSIQWFNDVLNNDNRVVELGEYLRLNIDKIDQAGKFSITGYGRGTQALTAGEGTNGRLYYLYGEYRDFLNKADIRVGRQFVNLSAGSALIDGGQVVLKNIGPVAFTVMGGHEAVMGLNGEVGNGNRAAMGAAAYLTGFKQTDLEVSWFRKTDSTDITRDLVGASFKQYLFNNIKLYGNTRYDLVSEAFNEVLGGIKYFPMANLILTGEYYQSYPTFDTNSIYSVFAVNQYKEGVFRADYTINDMVSVNGGYTREYFGDGGLSNVFHAGLGLRPVPPVKLNVEWDKRYGYYGSHDGILADVSYDVTKLANLAGGFSYDVFQRDSLTGDEIARLYWIGGKYKFARNMALSGRIQNEVNAQYSTNVTGRMAFDYDF